MATSINMDEDYVLCCQEANRGIGPASSRRAKALRQWMGLRADHEFTTAVTQAENNRQMWKFFEAHCVPKQTSVLWGSPSKGGDPNLFFACGGDGGVGRAYRVCCASKRTTCCVKRDRWVWRLTDATPQSWLDKGSVFTSLPLTMPLSDLEDPRVLAIGELDIETGGVIVGVGSGRPSVVLEMHWQLMPNDPLSWHCVGRGRVSAWFAVMGPPLSHLLPKISELRT